MKEILVLEKPALKPIPTVESSTCELNAELAAYASKHLGYDVLSRKLEQLETERI